MIRIWLNHWFSTAYNIIQMLKRDDPALYIIGTNEHAYAAYRPLCDAWYTEPVLEEAAYVQFCLDFCREHQVDVFMPRRNFLAISKQKSAFEAIGVRVMVDAYELLRPLNCKSEAYRMLADLPELHIPDYYVVTRAAQFQAAYQQLKQSYKRVCFKFEQDEGGKSFRLIDNTRKGYAALFKRQNTRMTFEDAYAALSEAESFPEMIVMPFLPDDEVSVDCLNTDTGLIMIPRCKGATRTEHITYDAGILAMCRSLHERFPLQMPFNVQFKYMDGIPYFLEVNTRMSGGIGLACAAAEVNIPSIAVHQLLGIRRDWILHDKEGYVTHVETPIIF